MSERARLAFVAGKGGVGRSTVAAAMAARFAAAGRRTLLVEAAPVDIASVPDGERRVGGHGSSPEAGREQPVITDDGSYTFLALSTQASLDEYVKRSFKLPIRPSRLRPLAAVFDYVALAAPGVREILTIGKIGEEVRSGRWDDVVVDAPASGHVIEVLTAPRELRAMVGGVGPLARESTWLADQLAGAETVAVLVSVAEALVVAESRQLAQRLAGTDVRLGGVVVNRLALGVGDRGRVEADGLDPVSAAGRLARFAVAMDDEARPHLDQLSEVAGERPLVPVPWSDQPPAAARAALDTVDWWRP